MRRNVRTRALSTEARDHSSPSAYRPRTAGDPPRERTPRGQGHEQAVRRHGRGDAQAMSRISPHRTGERPNQSNEPPTPGLWQLRSPRDDRSRRGTNELNNRSDRRPHAGEQSEGGMRTTSRTARRTRATATERWREEDGTRWGSGRDKPGDIPGRCPNLRRPRPDRGETVRRSRTTPDRGPQASGSRTQRNRADYD